MFSDLVVKDIDWQSRASASPTAGCDSFVGGAIMRFPPLTANHVGPYTPTRNENGDGFDLPPGVITTRPPGVITTPPGKTSPTSSPTLKPTSTPKVSIIK